MLKHYRPRLAGVSFCGGVDPSNLAPAAPADTASAHRRVRNAFARLSLSPTALRAMNATPPSSPHPTHAIIDSVRPLVPGEVMKGPSLVTMNKRCAYCNEPFRVTDQGIEALSADNQLVCSEFCAQALREEAQLQQRRAS